MGTSSARRGRWAERAAALIILTCGYRILKRNYAVPGGEIDLIAQKQALLIVVEVRYRSRDHRGSALASVDRQKQRRILRATERFLAVHPSYSFHQIRFDVLSFGLRDYWPHPGLPFRRAEIRWTKNAFTSENMDLRA